MRVLVDMDGTIADFERQFMEVWRAKYPDRAWIPHEERVGHYLSMQYPEEYQQDIFDIFSEKGFFLSLPPVEGAIQAMHDMQDAGLEVFICSTPFRNYEHCVTEKYQWVEKHLGFEWTRRIILTADKTIVRADVIIDDNPTMKGSEPYPSWRHILYKRPYNTGKFTWAIWRDYLQK